MRTKTSFLCSFCFRCLSVGEFVNGHWCCFYCRKNVSGGPPLEDVERLIKSSHRTKITIEDVSTGEL